MKNALTLLGLFFALFTYGQTNDDTIKVIAKLISSGQGSKVHFATYKVLKTIKGNVTNDTIQVGYYFYNAYTNKQDTSILTLNKYDGYPHFKDYYIFPGYNAIDGIKKAQVSTVDFKYWEHCETGQEACKPLRLTRKSKHDNWFLFMPCAGTQTTTTLSKQEGYPKQSDVIQQTHILHTECPPVFNLTQLDDGKYFIYMLGCGIGGQIEIHIETKQ